MHLLLRRVSGYVVAVTLLGVGVQRGSCLTPFVKFFKLPRSRNQEVPCVLFVKLSSHKKVSAGAGRVDPQGSCRNHPTKTTAGVDCASPQGSCRNHPTKTTAGVGCVSPQGSCRNHPTKTTAGVGCVSPQSTTIKDTAAPTAASGRCRRSPTPAAVPE